MCYLPIVTPTTNTNRRTHTTRSNIQSHTSKHSITQGEELNEALLEEHFAVFGALKAGGSKSAVTIHTSPKYGKVCCGEHVLVLNVSTDLSSSHLSNSTVLPIRCPKSHAFDSSVDASFSPSIYSFLLQVAYIKYEQSSSQQAAINAPPTIGKLRCEVR